MEKLTKPNIIMPIGDNGVVLPDLVGLCQHCREEISRNGVFNKHKCMN